MRTLLCLTCMVALLAGCFMPGRVSTTTSMLDGERQVHVDPGYLYGGGFSTPAKAGGYWSAKAPDQFTLEVVVIGSTKAITGLKVSTDGKIEEFTPSPQPTDYRHNDAGNAESSRMFVVPLAWLEQLLAAKTGVFQIQMAGSFVEARLFDQAYYARPALRKGLKEIQQIKTGTAK